MRICVIRCQKQRYQAKNEVFVQKPMSFLCRLMSLLVVTGRYWSLLVVTGLLLGCYWVVTGLLLGCYWAVTGRLRACWIRPKAACPPRVRNKIHLVNPVSLA